MIVRHDGNHFPDNLLYFVDRLLMLVISRRICYWWTRKMTRLSRSQILALRKSTTPAVRFSERSAAPLDVSHGTVVIFLELYVAWDMVDEVWQSLIGFLEVKE